MTIKMLVLYYNELVVSRKVLSDLTVKYKLV
jgi:hypothetical protein